MNILEQKLRDYHTSTALEQEVALTEIVQQLILFGLSRAGFFSAAAFHGGTCLRLLFGMRRFSEDLDFVLKTPSADFSWDEYLSGVLGECRAYGIALKVQDRKQTTGAVQARFLSFRKGYCTLSI